MNLFNIFKKVSKSSFKHNPKEQLRLVLEYIPDHYKDQRQYIYAVDFFKRDEWALTLESLIELTIETDHYFSERFWEILADTAENMSMMNLSAYCRKQIVGNQQELKSNIPFGWTTEKVDEKHFKHHIVEKVKRQWTIDRHKKDNVESLLTKVDGIYLKMNGRTGTLYIIDKCRLTEVDVEIGVTSSLILFFEKTNYWMLPFRKILTVQEKQNIRTAISLWASDTNTAIQFDDYHV
ncbi:hypothetical protein [Mucilaginibacter galii]|uniref:hypothetical protein n=1 Tax=Mucilaginibacter galii TaxID=2005073 RepID=UPI001665A1E6|nr:hypothetical protein [Mucilaginibacter galii]